MFMALEPGTRVVVYEIVGPLGTDRPVFDDPRLLGLLRRIEEDGKE
jgi:hypothetical protein